MPDGVAVVDAAQHRARLRQKQRLLVGGKTCGTGGTRAGARLPHPRKRHRFQREALLGGRPCTTTTSTPRWSRACRLTRPPATSPTCTPSARGLGACMHPTSCAARYHCAPAAWRTPFGTPLQHAAPAMLSAALHCFGAFDSSGEIRAARNTAVFATGVAKTPASVWGAECPGSPVGLSRRLKSRHCAVITHARMGGDAMMSWPFAASGREMLEAAAADVADAMEGDGASEPGAGAAIAPGAGAASAADVAPPALRQQASHARHTAREPCSLCTTAAWPSPECDVWHLLVERTHPHIVEHQGTVRCSAQRMLMQLCKLLMETARGAQPRADDDDDGVGSGGGRGGSQRGASPQAAPPAGAPHCRHSLPPSQLVQLPLLAPTRRRLVQLLLWMTSPTSQR